MPHGGGPKSFNGLYMYNLHRKIADDLLIPVNSLVAPTRWGRFCDMSQLNKMYMRWLAGMSWGKYLLLTIRGVGMIQHRNIAKT